MATIGLDKLFYSKITEDAEGNESYETPKQLAKAMTADLSVELAEATLYADDGAAEIVKEFKSGTLSLGVDDLGGSVASDLTGATIDNNGVVVSTAEDGGTPVAIGFRAKKSNGKYRYFWLYRVKFGIPPPHLLPRVTASPLTLPPLRALLCVVTRWMVQVSIPGRSKLPRVTPPSKRMLSLTGTSRCTNPATALPLPQRQNKEVLIYG